MARVWARADGTVVRVAKTMDEEVRYRIKYPANDGGGPEGVRTFQFDDATNAALALALVQHVDEFRVLAGPPVQLRRGGAVQNPAAPSPGYADYQALDTLVAKANNPASVITPDDVKLTVRIVYRLFRRVVG